MKSNHRSPIWPYLLVLAALFILSVKAPRAWQTPRAFRRTSSAAVVADVRRPVERATILRAQHTPAGTEAAKPSLIDHSAPRIADASPFQIGVLPPASDRPAKVQGADSAAPAFERDSDRHHATPPDNPHENEADRVYVSIDDPPSVDASAYSATNEPQIDLVETDKDSEIAKASEAELDQPEAKLPLEPIAKNDLESQHFENWPEPYALMDKLEALGEERAAQAWITSIHQLIERLTALRVDDPSAAEVLAALRAETRRPLTSEQPLSEPARRLFEQSRLDLGRRLGVWEKAAAASLQELISAPASESDDLMQAALAEARRLFATAPEGDTWRNYLLIERLERLASDTADDLVADRRRLAGVVLSRISDTRLSGAQQFFLSDPRLSPLKHCLRSWSVEPLPVGELLYTIEDFEQERGAALGRRLADQSAALGASRDSAQRRLGRELSRQYRNANLRIVVTRDLLNRLLPQPPSAAEPVQDVIAGVPAHGMSTTTSHLSVQLHPAAGELRLSLEATGKVDSQTTSTAGPVTFLSQGQSMYQVGKAVVIDRGGVRTEHTTADANNRTQLAGLQTDFDGVPLVRSLVRNYALSQHDEKKAQAQQEVEAKVASRATERFDAEVGARLAKAENDFRQRVLVPLRRLDLQPSVVELTTTADRLTARLRVAGDDQLAAHTPRPLAMSDSLASLQLHESVLNNALDRFQLAGRTFTAPELYRWIGTRLGRDHVPVPDDIPDNVVIKFADEDPVRAQCNDGRIELKLAIAELDDGRHFWQDFTITVFYRPQFEGLHLEFARDGAIELGGEYAGRTEFVLRGIFAKVFSQRRKLVFDPANQRQLPGLATLAFSSALVDNGWISITVAERKR